MSIYVDGDPVTDVVQPGPGSELATGGRKALREARERGAAPTPAQPARQERSPRARREMPVGRGTAVWILATVSLLALWFVLYAVVLTPFQESHQQAVLYNTMRERLASQTAPVGGAIAPGTPVALISAPSINVVDTVVVEGTASGDLMAGPGHRRDTALPGQAGVSVVYGRAALFGGPFGSIGSAHQGDTLTVTTGQGVFTYVVEDVRRVGSNFPPPLKQGAGRLTLVSVEGGGRFSALSPQEIVYVDAALQGDAQPTPAGRPAIVPTAETAMQGDPSSLLPLALALPLLLGAILAVVYGRSRWGGWQTWLVGMPIVLAALWLVSQAAIGLLPNLL